MPLHTPVCSISCYIGTGTGPALPFTLPHPTRPYLPTCSDITLMLTQAPCFTRHLHALIFSHHDACLPFTHCPFPYHCTYLPDLFLPGPPPPTHSTAGTFCHIPDHACLLPALPPCPLPTHYTTTTSPTHTTYCHTFTYPTCLPSLHTFVWDGLTYYLHFYLSHVHTFYLLPTPPLILHYRTVGLLLATLPMPATYLPPYLPCWDRTEQAGQGQ